MSTSAAIVAVFPALLIVGAILAPLFARRDRPPRFHGRVGRDDDRTARTTGSEQDAQTALYEPGQRLEASKPGPLPADAGDRHFADWKALRAKFFD
ncbi:MAG: hypothetical protein V1755_10295 [Chloroflexota bacterium]